MSDIGELNSTQCMALAHLHYTMKHFLCDYAEKKIDRKFFLTGMYGMIDYIDNFVRENGDYSCCDSRPLIIKEEKDVGGK